MVDPEEVAIRRINELERELEKTKGSFETLYLEYELLVTERDTLAERAGEAESLAAEWQKRHAEIYVAAEEDRNRAKDAEQKLDALQDLLAKAVEITGENK